MTKTAAAIIGGGISGLSAAHALHERRVADGTRAGEAAAKGAS